MEVVPGSLRPGDRWRLNAEATMHPFGVDFEINAKNRAVEISFTKKKSSHTTHTRQSIYYYLSFCLVNSISLPFFFFHPILLKNLGGNFSTITENVVILTLTYELSNCWFGENKAANKVVVRCFGHLFNAASENHRFSLSPSSPQFSTAQSLLRWCGLVVRNFFKTWKKNESLIRYAFKSLIAKSPDSREREMGWLNPISCSGKWTFTRSSIIAVPHPCLL